MKLQIMLLVLTLPLSGAFAQDTGEAGLSSYYQRVVLAEDGSATITIDATVADRNSGSVLIPLNYAKEINDLSLVESVASLQRVSRGGVEFVRVEAVRGSLPEAIALTFRAPGYLSWADAGPKNFDNYELSYQFTNTTYAPIQVARGELVLPESFVVHAIAESVPKVSKNDPVTPYTVGKFEGRHSLSIVDKDLNFGGSLYVKFQARKQEKSPIMLVFLLLLAVGYLVFYTDTLKKEVNGG